MDLRDGFVTFRWPDPRSGPYMVQIRMEPIRGRFEVVELAMGSVKDDVRITGSELREVRVAELARKAAELMLGIDVSRRLDLPPPETIIDTRTGQELTGEDRSAWLARREKRVGAPARREANRERAALSAVPRAPKRGGRADDAVIAEIYDEAFRKRVPTTKAIAERLGISETAAAKRVHRARLSGYLPPTEQGRAAANTQQRGRAKRR